MSASGIRTFLRERGIRRNEAPMTLPKRRNPRNLLALRDDARDAERATGQWQRANHPNRAS